MKKYLLLMIGGAMVALSMAASDDVTRADGQGVVPRRNILDIVAGVELGGLSRPGSTNEPLGNGGIVKRPIKPGDVTGEVVTTIPPGSQLGSVMLKSGRASQGNDAVNDVNRDGRVNIGDVTSLVDQLLNGAAGGTVDVNRDGTMSIADVTALIDTLLTGNAQ